MILTGDETLVGPDLAHRLVVAAVTILQLIDFSAARLGEQLVAHTDTKDRLVGKAHRLADVLYSLIARIRVTGSVRDEESVVLQRREIIVPGHPDDFHIPFEQAADNV